MFSITCFLSAGSIHHVDEGVKCVAQLLQCWQQLVVVVCLPIICPVARPWLRVQHSVGHHAVVCGELVTLALGGGVEHGEVEGERAGAGKLQRHPRTKTCTISVGHWTTEQWNGTKQGTTNTTHDTTEQQSRMKQGTSII